jgi:hypothetical protein
MQAHGASQAGARRPIDLMIIGAPKAGTTSLIHYLGQHPGILAHRQQEFIFFASDRAYELGYERAWHLYFGAADSGARSLVGKSVAMMYSRIGLERLREHNPAVELALVLRDPVDRAYSEFWYARRRGWESAETFESAVQQQLRDDCDDQSQRTAYLIRGRYAEYLEMIYAIFPRSQVSVLTFEQLRQSPVESCQALFRRLPAIDPAFVPQAADRKNAAATVRSHSFVTAISDSNRFPGLRRALRMALGEDTRQKLQSALLRLNERAFSPPPLQDATRRQLAEYFAPCNRKLEELIGRRLHQWTFPDEHCR